MYICLCHPFSDKDVQKHLNTLDKEVRVQDVYKTCSGGESMNCGSCACMLREIIEAHNSNYSDKQTSQEIL